MTCPKKAIQIIKGSIKKEGPLWSPLTTKTCRLCCALLPVEQVALFHFGAILLLETYPGLLSKFLYLSAQQFYLRFKFHHFQFFLFVTVLAATIITLAN